MTPLESDALGNKRLEQEEVWDCLSEPLCRLSVNAALVAVPAWDLKTEVLVFAVALELVAGESWASQGHGHWQPATGAYAGRRTDNPPGEHFSTGPALAIRYFVLYSVCLSANLLPLSAWY